VCVFARKRGSNFVSEVIQRERERERERETERQRERDRERVSAHV